MPEPLADWTLAPIVERFLPQCPHCGWKFRKEDRLRSYSNGDGTVTRRMLCGHCAGGTLLVEEVEPQDLPDAGLDVPCPNRADEVTWPDRITNNGH